LLVGPVEDGWIQGSDCIRLRIDSGELTPRFLSIGFREPEHHRWMMNQCFGGATMASLNQDILCRIPLTVPPSELIGRFDKFSTDALDEADILASKNQTLRRTRDLLLPKLLSGGDHFMELETASSPT
jgi:type I restriction enzyme S subunit